MVLPDDSENGLYAVYMLLLQWPDENDNEENKSND